MCHPLVEPYFEMLFFFNPILACASLAEFSVSFSCSDRSAPLIPEFQVRRIGNATLRYHGYALMSRSSVCFFLEKEV